MERERTIKWVGLASVLKAKAKLTEIAKCRITMGSTMENLSANISLHF